MIKFLKNILSTGFLCIAGFAFAAEPENILMIEVQGSANGIIEIELLPEFAPSHVERIKILARDGVYNNVVFHRVIEGFMAQTGDVKFGKVENFKQRYAGQGGSNYPDLEAEFSDIKFEEGTVGMARAQSLNSANSQFLLCLTEVQILIKNTQFWTCHKGQNIVNDIKRGARSNNGSVEIPDIMKRVWIKIDN